MTDFVPLETPAHAVNELPLMHPGRPIGRDDLLRDVFTHLQSREAVLLTGEAGAGKTALAAALAAAFFQQAGGVIWLQGKGATLPSLLVRIARGLGVNEVSTSEQPTTRIGALTAALAQRQPLIVLDDVHDALVPQQLIDRIGGEVPVLMTGESDLEGAWETIEVGALHDMDALTLYKQKSGLSNGEHDIDIYGLTKLLKYQPFGIVLAARGQVAAKQLPGEYLKNLKTVQQASGDGTMAAIALSYRALNSALQGLVLMLGATFRGEASVDFLAAVSGVPEEGIQQAMTVLAQLYLVQKFDVAGKPYYRLHPLVYQFAQAALKGKNQLAGLQQKVLAAAVRYANDHADDGAVIAKEMDNLIAAARWAAEQGNRDIANQMVTALTDGDFVQDAGYVYELLALRNTGSGSTQAFPAYPPEPPSAVEDDDDDFYNYDDDDLDDGDDDFDEYEFEDEDEIGEPVLDIEMEAPETFGTPDLGDLQMAEGMDSSKLRPDALQGIDLDQLRQALAQARQQGDNARIVQILKAIGKVQLGQERETEAITTYNELLELYEDQKDQEGLLDGLNMLAALLAKTGNSQAAVMHATRGIGLAQARGEPTVELQLHTSLGDARQDLGETQAAVDSFRRALEIARKTDDRQHEALALYKLGYAHLDNGNTDEAIHSLEQARDLFRDQDKRDYEGRVLSGLGSANSELERWSEAIGYYQSALHIAREVEDREEERLQLSSLAQAQEQANKLPDALLSYRQALHLAYETDDRDEIVSAIVDLVRLLLVSPVHLDICAMLLDDAMALEPNDKDVQALRDEVDMRQQEAELKGKVQKPVTGDARDYAGKAYAMLEQ